MRLIEILRPEHVVVPLGTTTLRGAMVALVQRLAETGAVDHPEQLEPLLSEERVRDVVRVGERVAIPHIRTDAVDRLIVALGVAMRPLESGSDEEPRSERIVVLILAPRDASNRYLQIVAALARALRQEETIEAILTATTPEEVLEIPAIRELSVQPRTTVRDFMTSDVARVRPDSTVGDLVRLMREPGVAAVPVVGEKLEVLGIVTGRDLLRHLTPMVATAETGGPAPDEVGGLFEAEVREIMVRSVMCISEDQSVSEAVATMIAKDVEHLPVVREGKLTGILHRAEILRRLFPT